MMQSIDFGFAGIQIRILSPIQIEIPQAIRPFLTEGQSPDEIFQIQLLNEPLSFSHPPVYSSSLLDVYREADSWIRVRPGMQDQNGCQVACRLRSNGMHTLYFPASEFSLRYPSVLTSLISPEYLLWRHSGFLLHSSVVRLEGKIVLFCGPSGIGKSTQAELWRTYLGAEILNGDRCAVTLRQDGFWGSGSPYCGSSGIYSAEEGPIAAIVLLEQSSKNTIRNTAAKEIIRAFYRETITNTWDQAYTQHSLSILDCLIQSVPIYTLSCRPDEDAALLAYQTIYK